jgi:hypothetical protein
VRVLVEEDAAREGFGVSEGTRAPDLRGHQVDGGLTRRPKTRRVR